MKILTKHLYKRYPTLWLVGNLISYRLFEKVQDNRCVELAIKEGLLWEPRSVKKSSLKGEVAETDID